MHHKGRFPNVFFGANLRPDSAALAILILFLFLIFVLLFMTLAAQPAQAQNVVPPTARQAASSPAFASRLAHQAAAQKASKTRAIVPSRRALPQYGLLMYDNGPYNGTTDAWTINFGFSTSDSFTGAGPVAGLHFVYWDASSSDLLTTVDISIGATSFGGTPQTLTGVTNTFLGTNQYGYNLYQADYSFSGIGSGSGYVTLSNACTTSGCSVSNPIYWDENSGVGCTSPGCPSTAYENTIGSIPSESFSLDGGTCSLDEPNQPQALQAAQAQSFKVIYNFIGGQEGAEPQGLTIDREGNFYGTTLLGGNTGGSCNAYGGGDGCGTVFKLFHKGAGWIFNQLYKFRGGDNGDGASPSSKMILGPDGSLYGATSSGGYTGGICGHWAPPGCGTVFNLKPPAHVCPTALCGWTETVLYAFKGWSPNDRVAASCSLQGSLNRPTQRSPRLPADGGDGAGPVGDIAFDQAGNIYGTTQTGPGDPGMCTCQYGPCGLIYALTPSGGGWQEGIVFIFDYLNYGSLPSSGIVFDPWGFPYTTTEYSSAWYGDDGFGEIWNPHFIFTFDGGTGAHPDGLIFDQLGNLFGTTAGCGGHGGSVFELDYYVNNFKTLHGFVGYPSGLVMDAAGSLYGTTVGDGAYNQGSVFKLTPGAGGWTYTNLYDFTGGTDGGGPSSLTFDANGNLWGTASTGGAYGYGVVFEITP